MELGPGCVESLTCRTVLLGGLKSKDFSFLKLYIDFRIWQDFENLYKEILRLFGHGDFS
jgi:hypothetical protein